MTGQLTFWLTAAALALLLLRPLRPAPPSAPEIVAGLLLGPLLLAGVLLPVEGFGDLRLRLLGVELESAAFAQPLRIGGDAARDDLVFDGLPSGLASLGLNSSGEPAWRVQVAEGGPAAAGAVSALAGGPSGEIAGSEALRPGDLICLARCATGRPVAFRLSAKADRLEALAGGAPLPPFKLRPLASPAGFEILPGWVSWSAEQAIYPLRDYGVAGAGGIPFGGDLCGSRLLCLPNGQPARSFIYRTGASAEEVRILLLDPEARIIRGGRAVSRPVDQPMEMNAAAGATRLRLYKVTYASPYRELGGPGRPGSRLELRGEILPAATESGLAVRLARPTTLPLRRADIERAARARPEALALTLLGGQAGADEAVENPLVLSRLGGTLAESIRTRLILSAKDDYGRTDRLFTISGASEPAKLGTPFTVGSSSPRRAAILSLERVDRPWFIVVMALCWAIVFGRAGWGLWRSSRPAFLLVIVAQWLLAVRLLVGIESLALDPALTSAAAIGANAAGYVALPLLLAAVAPRAAAGGAAWWPALLTAAGVAIASRALYGAATGWYVSVAAIVAAALLVAMAHGPLRERIAAARGSLPDWALALLLIGTAGAAASWYLVGGPALELLLTAGVLVSIAALLTTARAREGLRQVAAGAAERKWWLGLAAALVVMRVLFLFLGWRERLQWPGPFAISVIYVPLALLAIAGALSAGWGAGGRPGWRSGLVATLLVAVLFILVPALVGDNGLVIYLLPVMLVTLLVSLTRTPGEDGTSRPAWGTLLAWNLPALLIGIAVVATLIVAVLGDSRWERKMDAVVAEAQQTRSEPVREAAARKAAALLAEANADDQNQLRLWAAFAPSRVSLAGTSEAESQKRVASILADYSGSVRGRGFMQPSDPGDIRPYQADDNLSAVHLMSPFGRIGTALLLLVLGLLACRLGNPVRREGVAPVMGALVLWCMFATAVYMVLGNLHLVPFTGRNIYLLAALSASDLLESGILFLILMRIFAAPRPAP
ncbi:MAG TPA: hypothetical protein VF759_09695 [Allosphingosinicella sp.]